MNELSCLEASFRLKKNKYVIETNDRDNDLFIKKEVKNISVNKNKVRKF